MPVQKLWYHTPKIELSIEKGPDKNQTLVFYAAILPSKIFDFTLNFNSLTLFNDTTAAISLKTSRNSYLRAFVPSCLTYYFSSFFIYSTILFPRMGLSILSTNCVIHCFFVISHTRRRWYALIDLQSSRSGPTRKNKLKFIFLPVNLKLMVSIVKMVKTVEMVNAEQYSFF